MYQYWYISCNNVPHKCKMLIIGETVCREERIYEKSLYYPLNISVNLKLLSKMKYISLLFFFFKRRQFFFLEIQKLEAADPHRK